MTNVQNATVWRTPGNRPVVCVGGTAHGSRAGNGVRSTAATGVSAGRRSVCFPVPCGAGAGVGGVSWSWSARQAQAATSTQQPQTSPEALRHSGIIARDGRSCATRKASASRIALDDFTNIIHKSAEPWRIFQESAAAPGSAGLCAVVPRHRAAGADGRGPGGRAGRLTDPSDPSDLQAQRTKKEPGTPRVRDAGP